jgi:hypothetical protein
MSEGADGGPALFHLVRFWSRRWAGRASEELTGELRHVQHILVVEAVHTNTRAGGQALELIRAQPVQKLAEVQLGHGSGF